MITKYDIDATIQVGIYLFLAFVLGYFMVKILGSIMGNFGG